MRVSVIIPARNRAKLLGSCLSSLTKQTVLPEEIIVVDNCSTDNTRQVVSSFAKKLPVRYLFEKRIGPSFARNRGIEKAKGEILAFTDSDCLPDKKWLENIIKNLKKVNDKEAILQGYSINVYQKDSLFSGLNYFFDEYNQRLKFLSALGSEGDFSRDKFSLREINFIDLKNICFPRQIFFKGDLFLNENLPLYAENIDLQFRILEKRLQVFYAPDVVVKHLISGSARQFFKKRYRVGTAEELTEGKWQLKTKKKEAINLEPKWEKVREIFMNKVKRKLLGEIFESKSFFFKALFLGILKLEKALNFLGRLEAKSLKW